MSMVLVASTSFFGGESKSEHTSTSNPSNTKDPRIGVALVVLGCLAQGVQYVFEERVMAGGLRPCLQASFLFLKCSIFLSYSLVDDAPPLVVIGCEGLWGTVLTLLVVYPLGELVRTVVLLPPV